MFMIYLKRAYDKASKKDGYRVLVDRLWPRGVSKAKLKIDEWPKEITPSTEIRKKFHHEKKNLKTFCVDYRKELKSPEIQEKLKELSRKGKKRSLTLVYGARDPVYNHAQVLKKAIEKM
jgi:uncharacterized protein YeaO (DUF488 family)